MTETEINTAIAQACGWTYLEEHQGRQFGVRPGDSSPSYKFYIPNYCRDLNAMAEAESTLTEKQQVWYLQKLTQVRFKDGVGGMIGCMSDKTTFATARQRAEAFLRTLGVWKEES